MSETELWGYAESLHDNGDYEQAANHSKKLRRNKMNELKDFIIEDGVLVKYTGEGGDVKIPNSVTSIYNCAFVGCSSLTSITLSDSVKSIGACAFDGCYELTIKGYAGSYAETYAKENGIPFEEIKEK